jgi:hypothetical protein
MNGGRRATNKQRYHLYSLLHLLIGHFKDVPVRLSNHHALFNNPSSLSTLKAARLCSNLVQRCVSRQFAGGGLLNSHQGSSEQRSPEPNPLSTGVTPCRPLTL